MIIIVSGFHRSGTTVLFNYLKDIIDPVFCRPIALHKEKNLKKFIKNISNIQGTILIKCHIFDKSAIKQLEEICPVHIVYPVRNLKESISSYYKFSYNDYNVLTESYDLFRCTLNTLNSLHEKITIVLYSKLINNAEQTLKTLLKKFNITYTDDQIIDTINKWSLNNVKDYIAKLNNQDEDTLFYHNHISSSVDKNIPERYLTIILDMLSFEIESIKQNTKIDLLNI